jgi:hypothetical protein
VEPREPFVHLSEWTWLSASVAPLEIRVFVIEALVFYGWV